MKRAVKLAILSASLALPTAAIADELKYIGLDIAGSRWEIDPKAIIIDKDHRTVTVHVKPTGWRDMGFATRKLVHAYHCDAMLFHPLRQTSYDSDGNIISEKTYPEDLTLSLQEGSVVAAVRREVCSRTN